MRRNIIKTTGILGIIGHSLNIAVSLLIIIFLAINSALLHQEISQQGISAGVVFPILIAMLIIIACISIVGLVFSILTLKNHKKPTKEFKKGIVITAIVFDFLCASVILIVAGILGIVDLCNEKRRIASQENPQTLNFDTVATAKQNTNLEDKIEKLNSMKEQGLISEEEYNELKTAYIKEKLNAKL